tara:strand:- start:24600 stop:24923 length:324 start_codon:yes stop_codon:yes gene_type:complete
MSEDKKNVINLFPDMTDLDNYPDGIRDEVIEQNRVAMLQFLDELRGRVMSCEVRGIAMVTMGSDPSKMATFYNAHAAVDMTQTVGGLEFLKFTIMSDKLDEIDYEEE